VIYSAHWDHLGIGRADAKGDRIYNGALDNASGTPALIELGRAFAKAPRTDRSVVFLAVTAEEKGLLGSEYYATPPALSAGDDGGHDQHGQSSSMARRRTSRFRAVAKLGLLDDLIAEGGKVGRTFTPDPRIPRPAAFFARIISRWPSRACRPFPSMPGNDLVDGGVARGEALLR
jgi:Zn-dependent M28 family amino/carboxypeptidase